VVSGGGADGTGTSAPNVARINDYLLSGKDNSAADRQVAQQLMAAVPDIAGIARDNKSFVGRVVRFLAGEAGIRQFLDLGAGLPTRPSVHEIAQAIAPDARVVYVDNDPVVCSRRQVLPGSGDSVAVVMGDLRRPDEIIRHPQVSGLLDFSLPVGMLCVAVLHFVAEDEKPHDVIASYRDYLAPGSYLAITHGASGTPEEDSFGDVEAARSAFQHASAHLHVRSLPEIERFFDGFELVDPGIVWMTEWRPDPGIPPAGRVKGLRGGVGCKSAT
jgi:O-methyltransferase involved in polyketide biosynthesis